MKTGSTFRETLRRHEAKFGRNAKLRRELNMFLRGGADEIVPYTGEQIPEKIHEKIPQVSEGGIIKLDIDCAAASVVMNCNKETARNLEPRKNTNCKEFAENKFKEWNTYRDNKCGEQEEEPLGPQEQKKLADATPLSYLQSLPKLIQEASDEQKETLRTTIEKFAFSDCEECKNAATIEKWNAFKRNDGDEFDCDKCLNDALFHLPSSAFQEKKATLIKDNTIKELISVQKEKEEKKTEEITNNWCNGLDSKGRVVPADQDCGPGTNKKEDCEKLTGCKFTGDRECLPEYTGEDGSKCTTTTGADGICRKKSGEKGECVAMNINPMALAAVGAAEKKEKEECKKENQSCLGGLGKCTKQNNELKCVTTNKYKRKTTRGKLKKQKNDDECKELNKQLEISSKKEDDKINLCKKTFIKGDDGMKGYYPFRKLRREGISAEDIETHAGEFQRIDENKDGSIVLSELTAAYAAACKDDECKTKAAAKSLHAMEGQDGKINMEDFVRWASKYATKEGEYNST